jgi:alkylation response protein AidB-like acyl-CoA dehydrogenase
MTVDNVTWGPTPASDLDLLATEEEQALRDSLRSLLASRSAPDRVTALFDGDDSIREPLWKAIAVDLGLAGLLVPEELGGAGGSARDASVVLGELGRVVAPVPFLTSAVVATAAVLPSADEELLGRLTSGEVTAALVVPLTASATTFSAVVRTGGSGLSGQVPVVADAVAADVLLVPVRTTDGVELHVVEAGAPGLTVTPVVSLDMTRQVADVTLDDVPSRVLLGAGDGAGDGEGAVRRALRLGAALLASEQVGVAERCLEDTVTYLKQRRQFGRVLAGYQALKHRLADLYIEVESARAAAQYAAAAAAADDPDLPVAVEVAQAYCSAVAVHAAEECVQLHGGIGMTWEHPAHLYLKRAKADQLAFGPPGEHLVTLAGLVGLPPASGGQPPTP